LGDHRANHTIPPYWLDDRPPLLRHADVKPAAGWSVGLGPSWAVAPWTYFRDRILSQRSELRKSIREYCTKWKYKNWKLKYLGATITNINDTREEIKHRINMGNACYYSVQKLLSSSLLSKNLKVRIYKTVILPVVLYGCETWTLTLREEHRLRVLENKVLKKIFGAKRDEVTGEWRKLHNAELHALYSSPDIIRNIKSRRLRWAGHVARMGESRNAYRVLVGRPEGKRPLGRPRCRWEDIKMDLREVGYDDREWINLAQDRDQWRACEGGNEPPGSLKANDDEMMEICWDAKQKGRKDERKEKGRMDERREQGRMERKKE
ncbi:hypothetical protein ANN_20362, partial [Periplaneta americana]